MDTTNALIAPADAIEESVRENARQAVERHLDLGALIHASKRLSAEAEALVVDGPESDGRGADIGVKLKAIVEEVEQRRTELTGPLNTFVRMVNNICKPVTDPASVSLEKLRNKIGAYRDREKAKAEAARREAEEKYQREIREAERKAAEEARRTHKKKEEVVAPPPPLPEPAPSNVATGKVGSTVGRQEWDYVIEDEAKIPDMFWVVNEKAIRASIKAGMRTIPGLRIFMRTGVSFKS